MKKLVVYFLLIICPIWLAAAASAAAFILTGKVTKIIDGDSVLVRQDGRSHEIRLWGIDCPEYDQPYASAAKKLSKKLLRDKVVTVEVKNRDSYGRLVAVVFVGNLNANEELVRQGAAWVYSRYCRESICSEWKKLETRAKADRVGLWGEKSTIPPWKWRWKKR